MNYPIISEYIDAILNAEDNFATLTNLRPVLDNNGYPVMSSGNFAVVFKMKNIETNKEYAVKCFTREQEEREKKYRKIIKLIEKIDSPYIVPTKYFENELFVDTEQDDTTEFSVVVMEWVNGVTLDKHIEKFEGNSFELYELCYNFRHLSMWLLDQEFAHGDLKPDNILVKDGGQLVLIDYDGMFVPSMNNDVQQEQGTPNYRHPFKTTFFNSHMDDFSISTIALALKLISISYGVRTNFGKKDGLLFNEKDFYSLNDSHIFKLINNLIKSEKILGEYYSTFLKCYSGNILSAKDFDFQEERIEKILTFWPENALIFKDQKIKTGHLTENGIIYNKEGNAVIGFIKDNYNGEEIFIEEGVVSICEDAFDDYSGPKLVLHLPSTVRYFNSKSFNYKYRSITWDSPWFTYSHGYILTRDKTECILKHLSDAQFNTNTTILGAHLYDGLSFNDDWPEHLVKIRHSAFSHSQMPDKIYVPNGVSIIEKGAFSSSNLKELIFPSTIESLGVWCCYSCNDLEKVAFKNSILSEIPDECFGHCKKLNKVEFSNSIKRIGKSAFLWCESIENIKFPNELEELSDEAFCMSSFFGDNCNSQLKTIEFPSHLKRIGKRCFCLCKNIQSVSFTSELDHIEEEAFKGCSNLTTLTYNKIHSIKKSAFEGCNIALTIKEIDSISVGALNGCTIIANNSPQFILENKFLFSSIDKTLIYSWESGNIIEIPNGIKKVCLECFLHKPDILVLPISYNEDYIKDACFCQVVVVPNHFSTKKQYNNTLLTHSRLFIDDYGVIYTEDKKKLLRFPMSLQIAEYSILDECQEIGDNAFEGEEDYDPEFGMGYYGNSLEKLVLPKNMKRIGVHALYGCRKLTNLIFPEKLRELCDYSLEGCHSISQITLPTALSHIGKGVFPSNLQLIRSNSHAFHCCKDCLLSNDNELIWISPHIKNFELPNPFKYKGRDCVSNIDCIISTQGELLLTIPNKKDIFIPDSVLVIEAGAFCKNTEIHELRIPYGVKSIKKGAFFYNQRLASIYLPRTIKEIGNLHTYQGWGRKYIKFFYPKEIHIPKGMKRYFINLMPDILESSLIEDNN